MTTTPHGHPPPYVEPESLASEVRCFIDDRTDRLLLLTGVSGVGKTTLLRHLAEQLDELLYIDVSAAATPLSLLQAIYSRLVPEGDLLTTLGSQKGHLFSVYLTNVGNVRLDSTTLEESPIDNQVSIELSTKGDLFALAAKQHVVNLIAERPLTIALDQFEEAVDNRDIRLLARQLLDACPRLSLILASKRAIDASQIVEDGAILLTAPGLSIEESSQLLRLRGMDDSDLSAAAFSLCHGHPLFLVLFADALEQGLTLDEGLLTATRDEGLRLLLRHISGQLPYDLQRAFYYLPLCRFFTLPLVQSVLQLDSFAAKQLIGELCDRLYAQRVNARGLYRFHELLTNLQRREIPAGEQQPFDQAVVDFYRRAREDADGFRSLHELTEPFYHLQRISSSEAFEYFEENYKPVLDRKERGLAGFLINQIDLELHDDPATRNWFQLRIGGYHREFGDFKRALEKFEPILEEPDLDRRLTAYTLNNAAICQMFSRQMRPALDRFAESSQLCDELGLLTVKAHNFSNLGILWVMLNEPAKALDALETALALYRSEGVDGLFLGKVLHNYAGLLISQDRPDEAKRACLTAEQAYLKDNDLVGGILSRLRACKALCVQARHEEAFELLEALAERFDKILATCALPEVRAELAHELGMIRLYVGKRAKGLDVLLDALAHSLRFKVEQHIYLAAAIRAALVAATTLTDLADFIEAVRRDSRLGNVAAELTSFLAEPLATSWLVCDTKKVHHSPGCKEYKTGHYLSSISLVARADLLTRQELAVCPCLAAEHRA